MKYSRTMFMGFDLETPDLYNERICSMGISVFNEVNGKIENNNVLINPQCEFNQIKKIHSLELEDVYKKEVFPEVWAKYGSNIIEHILVIHNASFDLSVLKKVFAFYDMIPVTISYIDTFKIAKDIKLPVENNSLEKLAEFFEIDYLKHHDSGEDSRVCLELLYKYMESGVDLEKYIKNEKITFEKSKLKNLFILDSSQLNNLIENKRRAQYEVNNFYMQKNIGTRNSEVFEDSYLLSEEIAASYADEASMDCVDGQIKAKEAVDIFEKVLQKYPNSEIVAEAVTSGYSEICINELYSIIKATRSCRNIFEQFPDNNNIRDNYCLCLSLQAANAPSQAEKSVKALKEIFELCLQEYVAEEYSSAMLSLLEYQDYYDAIESQKELNKLKDLFPHNRYINQDCKDAETAVANSLEGLKAEEKYSQAKEMFFNHKDEIFYVKDYVFSATKYISFCDEDEEKQIIKSAGSIYEAFKDDAEIVSGYMECLHISSIYKEEPDAWKTIEKIRKIYATVQDNTRCAELYAMSLGNHALFENEHLNQCQTRLKMLFEKYTDNEIIAEEYCSTLMCTLDNNEHNRKAQEQALKTIASIAGLFPDNTEIKEIYDQAIKSIYYSQNNSIESPIKINDHVLHKTFGEGTVRAIIDDIESDLRIAEVLFDNGEKKRIVLSYLHPVAKK